jgi:hypothetical protein
MFLNKSTFSSRNLNDIIKALILPLCLIVLLGFKEAAEKKASCIITSPVMAQRFSFKYSA